MGTLGLSIGLGDDPILKGPIVLGKLPGTNALPFITDVAILVQYSVLKGGLRSMQKVISLVVFCGFHTNFPSSVLWFPNQCVIFSTGICIVLHEVYLRRTGKFFYIIVCNKLARIEIHGTYRST